MSENQTVSDEKVKPYGYMHFYYCSDCGAQIGAGGLCSWRCERDASAGARPIKIATYKLDSVVDGPPDAYAKVPR